MDAQQTPWRRALAICLLGLAVRTAFVLATRPSPYYANELQRIATYVAEGKGFRSPFGDERNDPSVHFPPIYPAYLAGIYMLEGAGSDASHRTVMWVNVFFGAATCAALYLLGRRILTEGAGILGGILFAFCPVSLVHVPVIWNAAFYTFWVVGVLLLAYRFQSRVTYRTAFLFGAGAGLLALLDTPFVMWTPFAVLAAIWHARPDFRRLVKLCLMALAGFVLVISPWITRNAIVTGAFVPIRGNLGLELWMGNHPGGIDRVTGKPFDGSVEDVAYRETWRFHPASGGNEGEIVSLLGERGYYKACLDRATGWIEAHPAEFRRLVGRRIIDFWVGPFDLQRKPVYWSVAGVDLGKILAQGVPLLLALLGLVLGFRAKKPVGMLAWALVVVPLPYYVTQALTPRYRHPLDPIIYLLAAYALTSLWPVWRDRWRRDQEAVRVA